jgi:hypothetical protein
MMYNEYAWQTEEDIDRACAIADDLHGHIANFRRLARKAAQESGEAATSTLDLALKYLAAIVEPATKVEGIQRSRRRLAATNPTKAKSVPASTENAQQ